MQLTSEVLTSYGTSTKFVVTIGTTSSVVTAEIRSRHRYRWRSPRMAMPIAPPRMPVTALPPAIDSHHQVPREIAVSSYRPCKASLDGRTLCKAFYRSGAEGRSGAQKAAPGTPH